MNFKTATFYILLAASLVSCNEYEKAMGPALKAKMNDKNPSPMFDGELEPAMPDPKENDKTLLGIDSNNNQIRDDIEIWINRTGTTYNERMALRQLAKALREKWLVGEMAMENFAKGPIDTFNSIERERNREIARKVQSAVHKEADASMGCLYFIFVEPKFTREQIRQMEHSIYELYNNSKIRKKSNEAFHNYNFTFGVTDNKANRYEHCTFYIQNLDQVKNDYEKNLKIKSEKIGF